jgi:ribonuclease HI
MKLILALAFFFSVATAQESTQVAVSRDSVLARAKIVQGWIKQQRDFLKQVPDVEKALAKNEAYLQGLLEPITDSSLMVPKKKGK